MKKNHKLGILGLVLAVILALIVYGSTGSASAADPNKPTIVSSPAEVPAGAVQTSKVKDDCATTTTWKLTTPGSEETSHEEFRYLRDIPGQEETSHEEYQYEKTVQDFKTQYHFRKFTHTKNGLKVGNTVIYGPYGPWTPWSPETHTSWEDSNTPLGSPAYHGDGHTGNTYWYREWQARFDGQTRQVENGSYVEKYKDGAWTTDQPGGEWTLTATRKVVDSAAVPGYMEYYVLGGNPSRNIGDASWVLAAQNPGENWTLFDTRTVTDEDGIDPVTSFYLYNDGVKCGTPPEKKQPPKKVTPPPAKPGVPTEIDAGL